MSEFETKPRNIVHHNEPPASNDTEDVLLWKVPRQAIDRSTILEQMDSTNNRFSERLLNSSQPWVALWFWITEHA
jgi:hypothetical protein